MRIDHYVTNSGKIVWLTFNQKAAENSRLRKENQKAALKLSGLGPGYGHTLAYWSKVGKRLGI